MPELIADTGRYLAIPLCILSICINTFIPIHTSYLHMLISQTRGYAGEKDRTRVIHNDRETRFTALCDSADAAY
ncbi:MAG: hypothetical protein E7576_15350 [Ruminococcaceae bacterium]|nr:hypothetical protein [Oscillospiraceae bacterium]